MQFTSAECPWCHKHAARFRECGDYTLCETCAGKVREDDMASVNELFDQICDAWLTPAVACWYKDQCRDPYKAFYLYYKASGPGEAGKLVIAEDRLNEDWELAHPQRISPAWGRDQVYRWCRDVAAHLPIMPY